MQAFGSVRMYHHITDYHKNLWDKSEAAPLHDHVDGFEFYSHCVHRSL